MASKVAALLLLGIICFGLAAADVPADCCLTATDKSFPHKRVASYKLQDAGKGCNIKATVILTIGRKRLCLVHPDEYPWVKEEILDHVDKRRRA